MRERVRIREREEGMIVGNQNCTQRMNHPFLLCQAVPDIL